MNNDHLSNYIILVKNTYYYEVIVSLRLVYSDWKTQQTVVLLKFDLTVTDQSVLRNPKISRVSLIYLQIILRGNLFHYQRSAQIIRINTQSGKKIPI